MKVVYLMALFLGLFLASALWFPTVVYAPPGGVPFQDLQDQIDAIADPSTGDIILGVTEVQASTSGSLGQGDTLAVIANCPPTAPVLIGGGARATFGAGLVDSFPDTSVSPQRWRAAAQKFTSGTATINLFAHALCAAVQ